MKQKAKELVGKFIHHAESFNENHHAKQCALICVDEVREWMNNLSADTGTVLDKYTELHFKDLEKLKQEIEKL